MSHPASRSHPGCFAWPLRSEPPPSPAGRWDLAPWSAPVLPLASGLPLCHPSIAAVPPAYGHYIALHVVTSAGANPTLAESSELQFSPTHEESDAHCEELTGTVG